jgi:membrane protease subunit (stomatin/prohibitin family)
MTLQKNRGGIGMAVKLLDVINFDDDAGYLIYKFPQTDFNLGSQLIVHESQEAVFFRDGKALGSFGPGRHTLETKNIPFLKESITALTGGENVFHSEIYFLNLATQIGIKWGTDSKIRIFDPASGLHIELGACGTLDLKITDGRKLLIKVVGASSVFSKDNIFGTSGYLSPSAIGSFRGAIISKAKTALSKTIKENKYNILEIDEHLDQLSEGLRTTLNGTIEDYGLSVPELFITTIDTPDDDPNYRRLKEQHAEKYLKVEQQRIDKAEAEAQQEVAVVKAETKAKEVTIEAEGLATAAVTKGKAEAEVMKAKGFNYQEETARMVGMAAASNESGGTGGIASDIAKAAVGVGVGVSVAGKVVDSVKPVFEQKETWECPECHHKGNDGNFCSNCGHKRG